MMVYSDRTAVEAILRGMKDLERAYDQSDHYRHGPLPLHVEDDLHDALNRVAKGLAYVLGIEVPVNTSR